MAEIHPSPERLAALTRRWDRQEKRLQAIARSLLQGEDWTVHLRGLPYVDEVPPLPGEALGRDLRGAPLQRWLRPEVEVREADERESARVAGVTLEGLRTNTALPGVSPFPLDLEGAEDIARAMRRGERFFLARVAEEVVGVVRWAERREFSDLTAARPYAEVSGLAVLPPWRRQGIGERLLAEAERDAMRRGHEHALLRTTFELGLVPWYERLGYSVGLMRQLTFPNAPTFLDAVMTRRLVAHRVVTLTARPRHRACREQEVGTGLPREEVYAALERSMGEALVVGMAATRLSMR